MMLIYFSIFVSLRQSCSYWCDIVSGMISVTRIRNDTSHVGTWLFWSFDRRIMLNFNSAWNLAIIVAIWCHEIVVVPSCAARAHWLFIMIWVYRHHLSCCSARSIAFLILAVHICHTIWDTDLDGMIESFLQFTLIVQMAHLIGWCNFLLACLSRMP